MDSTWTVIDEEYDHVVIAKLDSRIHGKQLQPLLIEKIKLETGLLFGRDYMFKQWLSIGEWYDYNTFQMCFKGAEPFTMFKMKYYG